jgi:hypothetical protein
VITTKAFRLAQSMFFAVTEYVDGGTKTESE